MTEEESTQTLSHPVVHNVHLIFIDSNMLVYLKLALQWILFLVCDPATQRRWIMATKHMQSHFLTGLEAEKVSAPSAVCLLIMFFVLSCFWTCLGDLLSTALL